MISKTKAIFMPLIIVSAFISFSFLAFLPSPTVQADHTSAHCQSQFSGSFNRAIFEECVRGIPETFTEWSAYCERGNPPDTAYSSCMQTYAGGESPPGMPGGVWCESSSGAITYIYGVTSCSFGSRTNDVPINFDNGSWCNVRTDTGFNVVFNPGQPPCATSSFTSPATNPFGAPSDPGDPPDEGIDPGTPSDEEAPRFNPDDAGGTLQTADPITCSGSANDNQFLCRLMDYVNFASIGVGIVAAITVVIAGLQYMSARGDPSKTAQAVGRLVQVGLAIVVFVFGWALMNWLIPGGAL